MDRKTAYRILGLSGREESDQIKKRYRELMQLVHPDTGNDADIYAYQAHEINAAYAYLTQEAEALRKAGAGEEKTSACWQAPVNRQAFAEREIYCYAEDDEGNIQGRILLGRGRYLWSQEEDFELFLLSIYNLSLEILKNCENGSSAGREKFQAELAYLLAQQFIDVNAAFKWMKVPCRKDADGLMVYKFTAMLETGIRRRSAAPDTMLLPKGIKAHRLFLEDEKQEIRGYVSFADDRLYYMLIPLFESGSVRVKIKITGQEKKYLKLALFVKMTGGCTKPENISLKINALLDRYREMKQMR